MTRVAAARAVAVLCLGYAGLGHLVVVPEHLEAWVGYGAFFAAVGGAQILMALALLRPRARLTSLSACALNAGVMLLYLASRTVGVPVGPSHTGHRLEPVGPLDLSVTAAELVVVVVLVAELPRRDQRVASDALLAVGAGIWAVALAARAA